MFSNLLVLAMSAAPQASTPPPPAYDQAAYRRCVDSLQARAGREGIGSALFDRHVRTVVPDTSVLRLLDSQPEFKTPIWDYLAGLVDEERVADGRQMLQRHADVLSRVEAAYGVDPATVVAVWGVESDFGDTFGKRPLLQSLTTLSCMGRRQDFFRGELLATLRIIRDGDVSSFRRPTVGWQLISMVTVAGTWWTASPTRLPRPPITSSGPDGALVSRGATRSRCPPASAVPTDVPGGSRCRIG